MRVLPTENAEPIGASRKGKHRLRKVEVTSAPDRVPLEMNPESELAPSVHNIETEPGDFCRKRGP